MHIDAREKNFAANKLRFERSAYTKTRNNFFLWRKVNRMRRTNSTNSIKILQWQNKQNFAFTSIALNDIGRTKTNIVLSSIIGNIGRSLQSCWSNRICVCVLFWASSSGIISKHTKRKVELNTFDYNNRHQVSQIGTKTNTRNGC